MRDYTSTAWLTRTIRYFRTCTFFIDRQDLSDDDLFTHIAHHYAGAEFLRDELMAATTPAMADQILLQADRTRVWSHDLEGVSPGEEFYANNVREWAAISRGTFRPQHVTETWSTQRGPIQVHFTVQGVQQTFTHVDGTDDFLDWNILRAINGVLSATPYRFERADDYPGECRFVVVLTHEEKATLVRERGWSFCDNWTT